MSVSGFSLHETGAGDVGWERYLVAPKQGI